MGVGGRTRALVTGAALTAADASRTVPLVAYRLSGRRVGGSAELCRAGTPRQWLSRNRIPGMTSMTERTGHVIHQDFSHCFTPWMHLISYRLRKHLRPVRDVARSETVVFRLERPFDESQTGGRKTRSSFEEPEVEEAFAHSFRITPAAKHSGIHAARVMLLIDDGRIAEAEELSRRLAAQRRLTRSHAQAISGAIAHAGHR